MPPSLYLAPLHGVTTRIFRNAYFSRFPGFSAAVAPFILSVKSGSAVEKHFKDLIPPPGPGPALIPQLLGNDPEGFVATARVLEDAGYGEINWNLGCPYPMVADKSRGSGLLPQAERIDRFLDEVLPRLRSELSVKIRLGRLSVSEADLFIPVLNRYPLRRVIVHPRLGVQMYDGAVDLDAFSAVFSALRHPVMYNGDIADSGVFRALADRFPAISEWMIGRWAVANPFLPGDILGAPRPSDQSAALTEFHDDLYFAYSEALSGPKHALDKMKEIWGYLSLSFPDPEGAYRKISRAKKSADYEAAVRSLIGEFGGRFAVRLGGALA